MRPLDKGLTPIVNGVPKTVTEYGAWRLYLIDRIGYYCAYCNMPLSEQLQVEHVVAKVPAPGAPAGSLLDWQNMLLSCGVCNRAKSNQTSNTTLHYLPESHNTHLPFEVTTHLTEPDVSIVVSRKQGLNSAQTSKAKRTIKLFALDVFDKRDKVVDIRWLKRNEAIIMVNLMYKSYLEAKKSPTYIAKDLANSMAYAAKVTGFFSLWYEKFINEPELMEALTNNSIIKGTATNCFDAANGFKPINRNPSITSDPF